MQCVFILTLCVVAAQSYNLLDISSYQNVDCISKTTVTREELQSVQYGGKPSKNVLKFLGCISDRIRLLSSSVAEEFVGERRNTYSPKSVELESCFDEIRQNQDLELGTKVFSCMAKTNLPSKNKTSFPTYPTFYQPAHVAS